MAGGKPDSAHSGTVLQPMNDSELTLQQYLDNNKGYTQDRGNRHYVLASAYVREKHFLPDGEYAHEHDCYYRENNCHIEERGGHRYLRPSNCTKFVLKQGMHLFQDYSWLYSYHGTHPQNVAAILREGLKPAGTDGVQQANGGSLGEGVYTSKLPLFAFIYAHPEEWMHDGKRYWVQTMFMVRQRPEAIELHGAEACSSASLCGRHDMHRLSGGHIRADETQCVTRKWGKDYLVVASLFVKVHEVDPRAPGGEYDRIRRLLEELDAAAGLPAGAAHAAPPPASGGTEASVMVKVPTTVKVAIKAGQKVAEVKQCTSDCIHTYTGVRYYATSVKVTVGGQVAADDRALTPADLAVLKVTVCEQ